PCAFGENVVVRILDRAAGGVRLEQLGISASIQSALKSVVERSHGLFLVTGPTGSGKTTTLYAMLQTVDAVRRNVATIEDPIEYQVPLLRQSQVDTAIDFSFSEGLRSLLRQDPDVVLVGEIRDLETADMAVKASMTGHLVFSTLHTNTSIGAVPRLKDIGVDPFLIEDALIGVLAQRLVRRVCSHCRKPAQLSSRELDWLDGEAGTPLVGEGCDRCGGSGFAGRVAIAEVFLPDDEIAEAIHSGENAGRLLKLARRKGFRTMEEDGKDKVRAGLTTRQEVQRVNKSHRLSEEEREDI
ncbi:MAG: GspE/PulE family protein, partial [Planctomycetota bacterium]